jgi:hypothetical protein
MDSDKGFVCVICVIVHTSEIVSRDHKIVSIVLAQWCQIITIASVESEEEVVQVEIWGRTHQMVNVFHRENL